MKKYLLLSLLFALVFAGSQAQTVAPTGFFAKADAFLKKNVSSTGVDYVGIKADQSELKALVDQIGSFNPSTLTKAGQKAFWLNAYNIMVIHNVVSHYPIAKPLDVPGFFDTVKFTVAGSSLTLSDIENVKVRPTFKDARVHFALVCAAKSCPPIPAYAFTADNVETKLEALTKAALNSASFIKVDDAKKTVQFSQILDWYKDDFFLSHKTILEYVNSYRTVQIPATYTQSFYTYNWALNIKK